MHRTTKPSVYKVETVESLLDIIHFTEHLSSMIFGVRDRNRIFDIINTEFRKSRKYNCAILLRGNNGGELHITRYSKPPKLITAAEKIYGDRIENATFKIIPDGLFAKIVFDGETIHMAVLDLLKEMLSAAPLMQHLGKLFRIADRMCVATPLYLRGSCIGILVMSSVGLGNELTPSVRYFSKNLSLALEFAEEARERELVQKSLVESEKQLSLERTALKEKNIALNEVLRQIGTEKEDIEKQIIETIDRCIMPVVANLRKAATSLEIGYLDLIEKYLNEISSPYVSRLSSKFTRLTPREITVCTMIKNGLSSKEIANLLHISILTVNRYREFIRKKLNIANEKVSLTAFLNSDDFNKFIRR